MDLRLPLADSLRFDRAFREGHTPEEIATSMQQAVTEEAERLIGTLESQQEAAEELVQGWTAELTVLSTANPQQAQLEEIERVVGDLKSYSQQLKKSLDMARRTLREQSQLARQAQQSLKTALSALESSSERNPQVAPVNYLGARACRFIAKNRDL